MGFATGGAIPEPARTLMATPPPTFGHMALGAAFVIALGLIVLGAILAFTDVLILESAGAILIFLGWALLALGVIILLVLLVRQFFFRPDESRGGRFT